MASGARKGHRGNKKFKLQNQKWILIHVSLNRMYRNDQWMAPDELKHNFAEAEGGNVNWMKIAEFHAIDFAVQDLIEF